MSSRRLAVGLLVAAACTVAACGGDDDGGDSSSATTAGGAETTATVAAATTEAGTETTRPPASTTTSAPSTTAAAVAADFELVVQNYQFAALTVPPGSVVHLDNRDAEPHTVSSTDGAIRFDPTTETFVAPSAAGSYDYVCGVHAFMQGTLTVA